MRLHIPTALGIFLLATGCSGDKGEPAPPAPAVDEVNVVPAELTAPAEGGELTIHLDATGDWEVIEPNDVRDLHGRICTLSGTADDHSIRFAARANTSGKELVTRFAVRCGRATADVIIRHPAIDVKLSTEAEVREYLKRLMRDTDPEYWARRYPNWGRDDVPLDKWGQVHYENGQLKLYLGEKDLKGTIDLSGCTALVMLQCHKNQLTGVNVSGCTNLKELSVASNDLTELNVDGCHSMELLNCSTNPRLSDIRIKGLTNLVYVDVSACNLTSLDLSGLYSMDTLACWRNLLTSLDIPERAKLGTLWCWGNRLTSLDVSGAAWLTLLNCGENAITDLRLDGCIRLNRLYCYENQLSTIDLSDQRDILGEFYCYSNKLERLDVQNCKNMTHLHCSDNWLTGLDLTGCKRLSSLYAELNRLTVLTLDPEISLVNCYLTSNRLTEIPLSSCHYGAKVWVRDNPVLAEIPAAADDFVEFEHDARYEYNDIYHTYTDTKRGWWYPGEPESGRHARQ